jgi:hypothetical protein
MIADIDAFKTQLACLRRVRDSEGLGRDDRDWLDAAIDRTRCNLSWVLLVSYLGRWR